MSIMIPARAVKLSKDEQRNRRFLVVDCKWCAMGILDEVEESVRL
jgi:hypothetical protein